MEQMQDEIDYCLHCKKGPCQEGCPLHNDISNMIDALKRKKPKEAYDILQKTSPMPFICGELCPTSSQCEGMCIRGKTAKPVSIGKIEAMLGQMALEQGWYFDESIKPKRNKKIAIIGAGPAGMTAGMFLAKEGWDVTIWEKQKKIGGILRYGIPPFRLKEDKIAALEKKIKLLDIHIQTEQQLGKDIFLSTLQKEYDAIFLAEGANQSSAMKIEGEELPNVFGANELLERGIHPNYLNKCVVVIGGGNVALDVSRTIIRKGAKEVTVIYRRAIQQMPAEPKEIEEARKDGVSFLFQTDVIKIEKQQVHCKKMQLVKKEGEKRLFPVPIPDSDFLWKTDYVVTAIGSKLSPKGLEGIKLTKDGYIEVNEKYETNIKNIYAAGDNVGRNKTIAWACFYAQEAAKQINLNY